MKKGFTLIELLAVIVILAIIALIATPIILNIIDDARKESQERSIDMYVRAVKNAIVTYQLTGTPTSFDQLEIEYDGDMVCATEVLYSDGSIYLADCEVNGELVEGYTYGRAPKSFAVDEWSTIVANVKAGNLSVYNVGDKKEVTLTGEVAGTYTIRIANTSTPEECSTEGFSQTACGFVIEFEDIITTHSMNSTNTNIGGWEASEMRTYINDTIYESFPIEIKENIIDTYVVSGHGRDVTTNYTTTDKLYLFSTKEVWGKEGTANAVNYDTAEKETRQLDYYKSIGVTTSNYSGAFKIYNGSATYWWLRSSHLTRPQYFYYVTGNGEWPNTTASTTYGVSVAFRIG